MIVLEILFKTYLLLSIIYTISNAPQNIQYQWKHSKESTLRKVYGIAVSLVLSMVFGGVSLSQKIYRKVQFRVKTFLAWYQIAKTAKQVTKTLNDTLTNEKKKS